METDAKYLMGMLNNPGKMPNATINHWVDYICTNFFFEIVRKKGKTFGPDRLSRRKWYPGDPAPEDFKDGTDDGTGEITWRKRDLQDEDPLELGEFYKEIDSREGFCQRVLERDGGLELEQQLAKDGHHAAKADLSAVYLDLEPIERRADSEARERESEYDDNRRSGQAKRLEERLVRVRELLVNRGASRLETLLAEQASLVHSASYYWLDKSNGRLYKKNADSNTLLLVVAEDERMQLLKACHDEMGYRRAYATRRLLQQRFWWPDMEEDVMWYVKTCHLCQIRQRRALEVPPVVTHTPSIFQVLYVDTVHMNPLSNECKYIVHSRCRLLSWMESRALREENTRTIGQWLFEDIICRWSSLVKIVTDNSAPFKKAVRWLEEKYGIKGVMISLYNSKANGVVERPHWDLRQMLYKATDGNVKKWFWSLHHVMWVDRVTVRKRTGCSPYFMVTGAQPTLPLDLTETTWLVTYPERMLSRAELIGLRAVALAKHVNHVEEMWTRVSKEKIRRTFQLERDLQHKIQEFDLGPGSLVLVKNLAIEMLADRKMKPRYLGPMVVVKRLQGGAYILAELDGMVWQNWVAAFRVLPYLARKKIEFTREVRNALDASEEDLKELLEEPAEPHTEEIKVTVTT